VKAASLPQDDYTGVFSSTDDYAISGSFQIDLFKGDYHLAMNISGTNVRFRIAEGKAEWQHIVVVMDGAHAWLYENGHLKNKADAPQLPRFEVYKLAVNRAQTRFFKGQIALVRVYARALSPEEVRLLYEQMERRWLSGRYIVNELEHTITPGGGFRTRISCSKTGKISPGWAELFGGGRERTDVAQEVRASESEDTQAPQPRTPADKVEVARNRFLGMIFTGEGKVKLSELERYPFTGDDIGEGAVGFAHLEEKLGVAVGKFYEAEDYDGTTGAAVSDDTASGGRARMASSTDEAGVLVEVS